MATYNHLTVVYHESPEILEVIFSDNSRDAVDEYVQVLLDYVQYWKEKRISDQPAYIILDVSKSGMYPINYGTTALGKIINELADLPLAYGAYITDSTNDRYMIERLRYFPSTRRQDTRRVFTSAEREQAIKWLLSNTDA